MRRFANLNEARPKLDGVTFKTIQQSDNEMLISSFEEDEIKRAVWDYEDNKSQGSDGFNFKFIKIFGTC